MPQIVKEIADGAAESRSTGEEGKSADSRARVFRVVLLTPTEEIRLDEACGVFIGDLHPKDTNMICASYDARYDGSSRMVVLVTFQYQPVGAPGSGQDQKDKSPDVRQANWSISASTIEQQVLSWRPRLDEFRWSLFNEVADNPAGDVYDGVVKLVPIVTISVFQWEPNDPTRNAEYVGSINEEEIQLGTLTIKKHQLLFTSMSATPATETWQETTYRGWRVEYQFSYKKNPTVIDLPEGGVMGNAARARNVDIGWDIAVPQTGRNVITFNPQAPAADQDVFGQPLRHGTRGTVDYGQIIPPARGGYLLNEGLAVGDKAPAMVRVFAYQNGGSSQAPSGQPISLNDDGTPRKIDLAAADPIRPIVYAYQVYESQNLTQRLRLRLF